MIIINLKIYKIHILIIDTMNSRIIKPIIFLCLFLLFSGGIWSQDQLERVEPPNWWAGMQHNEIEILMYGKDISNYQVKLDHPDAAIIKQTLVENPNYLFVELRLEEDIEACELPFEFSMDGELAFTHNYPIEARTKQLFDESVNSSDVMYLITPDRFANGNPDNDEFEDMPDKLNREKRFGRHGGDIQGIVDHLDYISDLGFTAIWLNPVIENDMPDFSYHGYAATDFYEMDARYGSNEEYRKMIELAAEKDIKIIMDMIMNHCGSEHWFVLDPPSSDWINFGNEFVPTSHKRMTVQDIHASEYDKKAFSDGWFVKTMPDMNQRNPLMARYLIQNTIWWIEYSKIAGIRMDTYPYPDKDFMTDWTCAIEKEYPGFFVVGEEWTINPAIVSYWQKDKVNHDGYSSCLLSLMDFPIQHAFVEATSKGENWNTGWIILYEMLANDFLYANPYDLVVFPDNHDMARFYTQINNDFDLFKMGVVYFSTIRGIPQFYYGTEILMNSDENPGDHGIIRSDFPGGWNGDKVNAVTGEGLNKKQKEAKAFMTDVLNWRMQNEVIHKGKLMQFAPYDGIYSFVRYTCEGKVLVVFNKNDQKTMLDWDRYEEILGEYKEGFDPFVKKKFEMKELEIPASSVQVFEFHH
jgi:glycosidase